MGWGTAADVEIGVGIGVVECQNVDSKQTVYRLTPNRVIPKSLVGSVYRGDQHLGCFYDEGDRCSVVNEVGQSMLSARMNCKTGKITIDWDQVQSNITTVVVSYEYHKKD